MVYNYKYQVIFTCIGLYFECTNTTQFQLPTAVLYCFMQTDLTLTHWLLELFSKNAFFGHFGGLRLDLDQISFNQLKMHLQYNSLPFLPLASRFMKYTEMKILGFSILDFFLPSSFSFSFFFLLQWLTFYWACLRLKNF